jgi:hypothetical protein
MCPFTIPHTTLAPFHNNIACCLHWMKRSIEAIDHGQKALNLALQKPSVRVFFFVKMFEENLFTFKSQIIILPVHYYLIPINSVSK